MRCTTRACAMSTCRQRRSACGRRSTRVDKRHELRRSYLCPCNSHIGDSRILRVAVAGGCPTRPGSYEAAGELGAPPVNPSNPNSRPGRKVRSPLRQGRVIMDSIIVGIDVSKDRLDIALRPSGETFAVERNAAGLELLAVRLTAL